MVSIHHSVPGIVDPHCSRPRDADTHYYLGSGYYASCSPEVRDVVGTHPPPRF